MPRPIDKRELFDVVERLDAMGVSGRGISAALGIHNSRASIILRALGAHVGRYTQGLSEQGVVRFEVLRADAELSARLEKLRECSSMKRRAGARLT